MREEGKCHNETPNIHTVTNGATSNIHETQTWSTNHPSTARLRGKDLTNVWSI
jgi:hypothetical protein